VIFTQYGDDNDLMLLDVESGDEPRVFLKTDAMELKPAFSPDGRWVAYQSNESGTFEVYVRRFPGHGGKWQISQGGGTDALWARDGKSLYFYRDDGGIASQVPVSVEGDSLRAGRPLEVFRLGKDALGRWDVGADGTFFMTLREAEEAERAAGSRVTFVFGWPTELERMVP
jgi:dipeptidyl aminopeptidase/acylaminoacyl peptidase